MILTPFLDNRLNGSGCYIIYNLLAAWTAKYLSW